MTDKEKLLKIQQFINSVLKELSSFRDDTDDSLEYVLKISDYVDDLIESKEDNE